MSIIVAERLRGAPEQVLNPRSRTLGYGTSRANLAQFREGVSNQGRIVRTRLNGLEQVPDWAWWLGGGLLAGAAIGGVALYMKRRRR